MHRLCFPEGVIEYRGMKIRLLVAYDGGAFRGWQSQKGGETVQDLLEAAVAGIIGEKVTVHGSGRTDSGVHALGQNAHFELTSEQVNRLGRMKESAKWVPALNSVLPPGLRVLRATRAPHDFHARFSATGKIYRYDLWNAPVLPPHLHGRVWHVHGKLDHGILRELAGMISGTHNFRGFCADSGSLPESTKRTIRRVALRFRGPALSITFEGDGFLYRMVRMLVGAMIRAAQGKEDPTLFVKRLAAGKPWPTPAMAPAPGLYMVKALYARGGGGKRGQTGSRRPTA
jgi:tRNA pseudouridine38-40 synthase